MLSIPEQHPRDNHESPTRSYINKDRELLESLVPPRIGERVIELSDNLAANNRNDAHED
jgi:hypothetical protein